MLLEVTRSAPLWAVREARARAAKQLRGWPRRDEALVVVSELVTNAIQHGQQPWQLALHRRRNTVRIEVSDASTDLPELGPPLMDNLDGSGRGLRLVEALAARWGVERYGDGKTVWAELRR